MTSPGGTFMMSFDGTGAVPVPCAGSCADSMDSVKLIHRHYILRLFADKTLQ